MDCAMPSVKIRDFELFVEFSNSIVHFSGMCCERFDVCKYGNGHENYFYMLPCWNAVTHTLIKKHIIHNKIHVGGAFWNWNIYWTVQHKINATLVLDINNVADDGLWHEDSLGRRHMRAMAFSIPANRLFQWLSSQRASNMRLPLVRCLPGYQRETNAPSTPT